MNGRSLWSGCPAPPALRVCWWPEGGRGLQQRATPSLWSQTRGRYLTWPGAQLALMKHRGGWGRSRMSGPPSVLPTAQSPRLPHQGPRTGRERIDQTSVHQRLLRKARIHCLSEEVCSWIEKGFNPFGYTLNAVQSSVTQRVNHSPRAP